MRDRRRVRDQLERGLAGSGPLGPAVRAVRRAYTEPLDEATTERHISAIVAAAAQADADPATARAFAPRSPRPRAMRVAPRLAGGVLAGLLALSGLAYAGVPVPNPVGSVVDAVREPAPTPAPSPTPAPVATTADEEVEPTGAVEGSGPVVTVSTNCREGNDAGTCTAGDGSTATKGTATATKGTARTTNRPAQPPQPTPAPAPPAASPVADGTPTEPVQDNAEPTAQSTGPEATPTPAT